MISFLRFGAFYIALLAIFAVPVLAVARRYGEHRTVRRWLIAIVVAGTACGLLRTMTERLETQCRSNGNTQCFDYGGMGLAYLIITVFLATSLIRAYLIHND